LIASGGRKGVRGRPSEGLGGEAIFGASDGGVDGWNFFERGLEFIEKFKETTVDGFYAGSSDIESELGDESMTERVGPSVSRIGPS
jgi:hypothetical protein